MKQIWAAEVRRDMFLYDIDQYEVAKLCGHDRAWVCRILGKEANEYVKPKAKKAVLEAVRTLVERKIEENAENQKVCTG